MRSQEEAGLLADALFENGQINPRGFREPPTGKHSNGRDRKPTLLELACLKAGIVDSLPKRDPGRRRTDQERITKGGQRGILVGDRKTGRARLFRA